MKRTLRAWASSGWLPTAWEDPFATSWSHSRWSLAEQRFARWRRHAELRLVFWAYFFHLGFMSFICCIYNFVLFCRSCRGQRLHIVVDGHQLLL
jgi:hypothetical protein